MGKEVEVVERKRCTEKEEEEVEEEERRRKKRRGGERGGRGREEEEWKVEAVLSFLAQACPWKTILYLGPDSYKCLSCHLAVISDR